MCAKHLNGGPLVCLEASADEHDGHSHHYATTTGSWAESGDKPHDHG